MNTCNGAAQDHMANERTYLAWVRTCLGGVALGVALERFAKDGSGTATAVVAGLVIAASLLLLGWSTRRYYRVAAQLEQGRFQFDQIGPLAILCGTVIFVAVIALLAL